jgi:hypothetical protein
MLKLLPLVIFSFLLAACSISPNRLGIPESQWAQYDDAQRKQIIEDYRQVQAKKKEEHAKSGNSILEVNIEGGSAIFPPYTESQPYQPITFSIQEGDCNRREQILGAGSSNSTILGACYKDQTLFLDPSAYEISKADGSIQLQYMPVWKRGFTYPNISSTGLARLQGVNITIKETAADRQ